MHNKASITIELAPYGALPRHSIFVLLRGNVTPFSLGCRLCKLIEEIMKKNNPPPDQVNAAILAAIRGGAAGRSNAYANRRALLAKASWFTDFDHFRRLCLGDLRQAYIDDRRDKTRTTKNRRLTWLAMFRCFAAHAGIDQDLEIIALDRQGNYACNLIDPTPVDDWERFVRLGAQFGITEQELTALRQTKRPHPNHAASPSPKIKAAPQLVENQAAGNPENRPRQET